MTDPMAAVNVLVVDDDRSVQRLIADVLSQQGLQVTLERDGEFALKTFESKDFDLVVLDLLLPGINGYEVARRLRESPRGKNVPVVMISGVYKNALHQREAMERYGAAAFVEKPFKVATLTDALRKALGDRYPATQPGAGVPEPASEPATPDRLAGEDAVQESATVERSSRSVSSVQAIRGDFEHKPFPEVLAEIYRWKGTGALLLRRDKIKKIVYFRDGVPQFIKSNLLSECLGRVLVRERMISEIDCEASLKKMKASGRQQGTVLIEMGCISPHNLSYALNLQMRAKLFDVFTWRNGDYAFDRRAHLPPETVHLDLSTAQAIYEGVRRSYDADRLARALGPVDDLYVHPAGDPLYALQEVGLGEEEHALLLQADGRKTVRRLRALSILTPQDTDKLVYAMRCARVIELRDRPAEGTGPGLFEVSQSGSGLASAPPLPVLPGVEYPTPPPLRRTAKKATVPFHGVDTGPLELPPQEVREDAAPNGRHPELSGGQHAQEEESVVRERLAARIAAMRKQDYFEILGLPRSADDGQIAMAYLTLARENHPDKHFASASAEIRQLATQIYDLITFAHDTLQDPQERAAYEAKLDRGEKVDSLADEGVAKIIAAEGRFQKGEELMRQGEVEAALRHFEDAVKLYAEEGEFHAYLGWARFQLAPLDPDVRASALASLQRAVELNPRSDKPYLFTGYIHKATGQSGLAQSNFEKAIQANPGCTEALKELSILNWAARLGGLRR